MQLATPRHAAARVYRALAVAYHQPAEAIRVAKNLTDLRESLSAAGAADLAPLVAQMAGSVAAAPDKQDLTVEYCRLFYGPGKLVAPPYESVYLGGGVLMGEPTLGVLRRYEEAGVQVWEGFRDCPDHIAAELEYLFFTAREAANFAALGRADTAQLWVQRHRAFLSEHLAAWVKPFAVKVLEGSQNVYYRALVELTLGWVERENGQ